MTYVRFQELLDRAINNAALTAFAQTREWAASRELK